MFSFPFGGSVLCKCVCKHSFDSCSPRKRAMCHTSNRNNTTKLLTHSYSPHLGHICSNRKQVIHPFVLRSHENICFIQKLNTVTVCYNFFFLYPIQVSSSMTTKPLEKETKEIGSRRGGLDNITCAAFGKTTDTLQQSKITRVTKAQGGAVMGESEGEERRRRRRRRRKRGGRREQVRKEAVRQDVLRCPSPRYYFLITSDDT